GQVVDEVVRDLVVVAGRRIHAAGGESGEGDDGGVPALTGALEADLHAVRLNRAVAPRTPIFRRTSRGDPYRVMAERYKTGRGRASPGPRCTPSRCSRNSAPSPRRRPPRSATGWRR